MVATEEYIAIGTLIIVIASALALVIKQIELSRCSKIKCCGMDCGRVPPANDPNDDSNQPEVERP
eukprot:SAG11_NODE_18210_length_497_cov_0.678392_1_plen_65_part_00